jgi:hypothetical protein
VGPAGQLDPPGVSGPHRMVIFTRVASSWWPDRTGPDRTRPHPPPFHVLSRLHACPPGSQLFGPNCTHPSHDQLSNYLALQCCEKENSELIEKPKLFRLEIMDACGDVFLNLEKKQKCQMPIYMEWTSFKCVMPNYTYSFKKNISVSL